KAKGGCTSPCSYGADAASPRADPGAGEGPLSCSFRSRISPCRCQFALGLQICQHACPATDAVTHLHLHVGVRVQQYVCARAKFDQSHPLAALQPVAYFGMEDDSSRQQSCDLLEHDRVTIAFHANNILLVFLGGCRIHGVQKFSALITHLANHAADRGTIYVNIKNTQENADAELFFAADGHWRDVCYLPVGRRNYGFCGIGNGALRIAKEPKKK